jgi:dUTP pyrophosphatase
MYKLGVYKTHPNAVIPRKASHERESSFFEDAAWDLFHVLGDTAILAGETKRFDTGLKIILPVCTWAKFHDRSGLALKGLQVLGGVIDNSYTGSWIVILHNSSNVDVDISSDKAIAQFTIEQITPVSLEEIQEPEFQQLAEYRLRSRGDSGFGSSDKNAAKK